MMKALCVCNSGAVRSVTLQRMLTKRGDASLAVGADDHDDETLRMLGQWADVIYVADEVAALTFNAKTGHRFAGRISLKHVVGPDDWKIPQHPALVAIYRRQLGEVWV